MKMKSMAVTTLRQMPHTEIDASRDLRRLAHISWTRPHFLDSLRSAIKCFLPHLKESSYGHGI